MKTCPNCRELVGNEANTCFNCGYNFATGRMPIRNPSSSNSQPANTQSYDSDTEQIQNQILKNARYEYILESVQDNSSGSANTYQIQSLLTRYAQGGWRLHSVFRNELGRNSRQIGVGGFSGGTNATIEQTILIFERCIKPEE